MADMVGPPIALYLPFRRIFFPSRSCFGFLLFVNDNFSLKCKSVPPIEQVHADTCKQPFSLSYFFFYLPFDGRLGRL